MESRAHVIVLGNEKGGSGKSTTAMHIFAALARKNMGADRKIKVGAVDLDTRQKSFFRYLENRAALNTRRAQRGEPALVMPIMREVSSSDNRDRDLAEEEELERFTTVMSDLMRRCDVIIVDCPGTDTFLSRVGHGSADTLITPLNDSFVDFDLLARVDVSTGEIISPSIYAEMVWETRKLRAEQSEDPINWVVLRNRLPIDANMQSQFVDELLDKLSNRIGFRVVPGFKERTIYRELFLYGLTLFDLRETGSDMEMQMGHVAARREMSDLLSRLSIPVLRNDGNGGPV